MKYLFKAYNYNLLIFLLFFLLCNTLFAQEYYIDFVSLDKKYEIDSIKTENITTGATTVLLGNEILVLKKSTNSAKIFLFEEFNVLVYPNPFNNNCEIVIDAIQDENINIGVIALNGQYLVSQKLEILAGKNSFNLTGIGAGIYFIKVTSLNFTSTKKVISTNTSPHVASLYFSNYIPKVSQAEKSAETEVKFEYNVGDILEITGYSENRLDKKTIVPTESRTIQFDFSGYFDIDGNQFSVTKIGNQLWMAENLKVSRFNDGAEIPCIINDRTWSNTNDPGYCYYDDSLSYFEKFGNLYNWYVVKTEKICPVGWRVPSVDDWNDLENYLTKIGYSVNKYSSDVAKSLATSDWFYNIWEGTVGNDGSPELQNITGFSAIPGGVRNKDGSYGAMGAFGAWWTSTFAEARGWDSLASNRSINVMNSELRRGDFYFNVGASIRCIKNNQLPIVITDSIYNMTSNSVKIANNIQFFGDTSLTDCGVCWDTNPTPSLENNFISSNNNGNLFISKLSGLDSNENYYIRAFATNSEGTSYGNELFISLSKEVVGPMLITQNVKNTSATSAECTAKITNCEISTILEKGVCWSTYQNPTISEAHSSESIGDELFTTTMTDLSPVKQTYYVRAYMTTPNGTAYGNELVLYSQEQILPPTVITDFVSNIKEDSIFCGATITSDGGAYVTERGFCWDVRPNATIDKHKWVMGAGNGEFSFEWGNLQPNTTYYLRAYAINNRGVSYGNDIEFTTSPETQLPQIRTLNTTIISENSVKCDAEISSNGGGSIQEAGFCWSTSKLPTIEDKKITTDPLTEKFSCTLTGLNQYSTYYIRAYAINRKGVNYGNEVSITCEEEAVSPNIFTQDITDITKTSAKCIININSEGSSSLLEKGICWSTKENVTINDSFKTVNSTSNSNTIIIDDLLSGTIYFARAYARNEAGIAYGNLLSFCTVHNTITDVDGNIYNTITIGEQTWMLENLKTTKYNDGTNIPYVKSENWDTLNTAGFCFFENDEWYKDKYGALYNWYSIQNDNVCPTGWHISTDEEWDELKYFLRKTDPNYGGFTTIVVGKALASKNGWRKAFDKKHIGYNPNENNRSGFTALPAGSITKKGEFIGFEEEANWWCPDGFTANYINYSKLVYNSDRLYQVTEDKKNGFSIRCIKDE